MAVIVMGKEKKDFGKQIEDLVQNAIDNLEFERLSKELGNTMKQWNQELNSSIRNSLNGVKNSVKNVQGQIKKSASKPYVPIGTRNVGKTAGILYTVFGWIGITGFGIASIVLGILQLVVGSYTGMVGDVSLGLMLVFLAISACMAWRGGTLLGRNRRITRYLEMLCQKGYCEIEALAERVNQDRKKVLKDIEVMFAAGVLPEGHLDRKNTCLIGNEELYEQYQQAELERERQLQQEQERQQQEAAYSEEERQILVSVEEGRAMIRQIQEVNQVLLEQVISEKLDRLEQITDKIFVFVEQNPEQIEEIRRLKNYYLPTILKLVMTYQQLEMQTTQGENIRKMKQEIQNTFDTVNDALETMYDQLYSATAMDISADISVLKTMLKREGLVKDEFVKTKEDHVQ